MKSYINICVCLVIMCAMLFLSSCSVSKSYSSKTLESTTGELIQIPTMVELDVLKTKVNGEIDRPSKKLGLTEIKSNVIALALESSKADVLIEPRFQIERKKSGKIVSIKVSGYPAMYNNFRKFEDKDTTLLKYVMYKKAADKGMGYKFKKRMK